MVRLMPPSRPQPPRARARRGASVPAGGRPHYESRQERNFELPGSVSRELREASTGRGVPSLERRLGAAARAYERDRYPEALAAIRPVVDAAPASPAVRELYGLILYRLGRWRNAAKELREFHVLSKSFDQHPVIADCERAMGHLGRVEELWTEIRRAGVDRDVLVEGRLVMAGALADAGRLGDAIEILKPEGRSRKNPDLAHLREWYALADLYERAGDVARAREYFRRVALAAPDLLDAPERLAELR
jgi:tetratricopeptide (TPR) repeat protein